MNKQIRKILALTLALAMVVTSMTFVGSNNLKAADEEAANQVEQTTDQATEPAAETPEVSDPVTSEETLDVSEETPSEEGTDQKNAEAEKTTEETPVVTPVEEAAPELKKPAQTLSANASDGAKIIVDAKEGVLPEGSSVKVKVVSAASVADAVEAVAGDVNSMAAYDITIHDKDGKEIQPEGNVSVKIQNANIDGEADGVFHVNDAKTSAEPVSASTSGDDASFKADHFSIYVVTISAGKKTPELATYNFYNGSNLVSSQIVKTGDKLNEPASPERENAEFLGWYNGETLFEGFGVQSNVNKTETINLYAKFSDDNFYVFFRNAAGQVIDTQLVANGDVIDTTKILLDVGEGKASARWFYDPELKNPADKVTINGANVNLYPETQDGNWITYESEGGSYVDATFVAAGDKTKAPESPVRAGYKFLRWSTTKTGSAYQFGKTISADLTLYAVWEKGLVDYTVIYFTENANDTGYSYHSSETLQGNAGETTKATAKTIEGFTAQKITQKTIQGDGTTIVNVLYSRNVYKVVFKNSNSISTTGTTSKPSGAKVIQSGSGYEIYRVESGFFFFTSYDYYLYVGGKYYEINSSSVAPMCGKTHAHSIECFTKEYTIEAKHGAYIGDKWPGGAYRVSSGGNTWQAFLEVMPLGGQTFYSKYSEGSSVSTASYYVEDLKGQYVLHHQDKPNVSGCSVTKEDKYELLGFTYKEGTSNGSNYNGAKFYYTRNSYNLTFMVNGKEDKKVSKKFESSLKNDAYTPVSKYGYEFAGWYDNEYCEGSAYDFSSVTMPAHNLVLYAKWVIPNVTVTAYDKYEGGTSIDIVLKSGDKLTYDMLPEVKLGQNEKVLAWVTKNSSGKYKFVNIGSPVYRDITIYPLISKVGDTFTVTYNANGGQNAPVDNNKYIAGSSIPVASGKNMTPPTGKVFLKWNTKPDGTGKSYKANADMPLLENTTLYAQWGDAAELARVTYSPGDGTGTPVYVNDIPNNGEITLKTVEECGFAMANSTFVGWQYTDRDGETQTAQPGAKVRVDSSQNNVITALWQQVSFDVTYRDINTGSDKTVYTEKANKGKPYTLYSGYNPSAKDQGKQQTVFYGWTTDQQLGNVNISSETQYKKLLARSDFWRPGTTINQGLATSTTYYAVWVRKVLINNYSITFAVDATGHGTLNGTLSYTNIEGGKTWGDARIVVPTYTADPGYKFDGWYLNGTKVETMPTASTEVDEDQNYIAKFVTRNDMEYRVQYYYETENGSFVLDESKGVTKRAGTTGATVAVTDADKTPKSSNYYFDTDNTNNVLDGTVPADSMLILKVYFGMKNASDCFTVTGQDVVKTYDATAYTAGTAKVTEIGKTAEVAANIKYSIDGGSNWVNTVTGITATNVADSKTVRIRAKINGYKGFVYNNEALTINPLSVTVKADNKTKKYGEADPAFTATETGVLQRNALTYGFSRAEGSAIGKYAITVTGAEKQGNYSVTYQPGELAITKSDALRVNVTSNNYEGVYDAAAHGSAVVPNITNGTTVKYSLNGGTTWQDEVPTITNVGTKTVLVKATNDNYEDATGTYTLKVTQKTVTVTADNKSKTYGASDPTLTATVSGNYATDGYTVQYALERVAGESVGDHSIMVSGAEDQGNYKVEFHRGTLTISKAGTLTVSGTNYTGVYDGIAHGVAASPSVTEGTVVSYKVGNGNWTTEVPTITNVGEMTVSVKATNNNFDDATASYKLKVTPATATVKPVDKNKTYGENDPELTAEVTGLVGDDTVNYTLTRQTGNNAGEYVIYSNGQGTQGNYTVVYQTGKFTIKKANTMTVSVENDGYNGVYDADSHKGKITASVTAGTTFEYSTNAGESWSSVEPSITDVGTKNVIVKAKNPNYEDATANYTLTVTAKTVTITAIPGSKLYGADDPALRASVTGLLNNDEVAYTVTRATGERAGQYTMTVNAVEDQGNYKITKVGSKFTINKRSITLTSASDSREFNGKFLTNNTVTLSGDGFVSGEGYTVNVTGKQKRVGSSANTFTYSLNEGTSADNYEITANYGTLTVINRGAKYQIEVVSNSNTVKYDGTQQSLSGFVTLEFYEEGEKYTVTGLSASTSGTNAGEYTNTITGTAVVKDADNEVVTDDFAVTTSNGTLNIEKRNVTLTSGSATSKFNGNELINHSVTVSGDGFVSEQGATYTYTGTQTVKGKSDNVFDYTLKSNTDANNYNITKVFGTLEVGDRDDKYQIVLEANSGEFKYDGTTKSVEGIKKTTFTVDGHTYYVSGVQAGVGKVDAGTYQSVITGTPVVKTSWAPIIGKDVTDQFNITTQSGTLKIKKRSVTLTSATDSKVYDGTALTNDTVTVSGDGFAIGEGATYNVTGSRIAAGVSSNVFTYTLNDNTKADNYIVHTVNGNLTVNKSNALTLNVDDCNYNEKYDGDSHGQAVTADDMEGTTIYYSLDNKMSWTDVAPTIKDVGEKTVDVLAVNDNYDDTYGRYTLKVTKRHITLTSATDTKDYDGTALTNKNVTVTGDGFAKTEGASYEVTGTQTSKGSSKNLFSYTLNDGTKATNYIIATIEGDLTVSEGQDLEFINLSGAGCDVTYDGEAHGGAAEVNKKIGTTVYYKVGDDGKWTTDVPTRTNVGEDTVQVKAENPNYKTAEGSYTLKVKPKKVTVTADDKTKVYGKKEPALTATVEGTIGTDTVDYTVSRQSGSDVGTYTITPAGDDEQGNYTVEYKTGTLTITQSDDLNLDLSGARYVGYYDGQTHGGAVTTTAEGTTTIKYSTDNGQTWSDEYPTQLDVGSVYVKVKATNKNYKEKVVEYSIIVRPRPVTLKSANLKKEWDGNPLTNGNNALVTNDGWVEGEGTDQITFKGSQTAIGTSNNEFDYTLKSNTKASNYAISKVEGALSVTDRESKYELTVVAKSGTKTYNGETQTLTGIVTDKFTVNGHEYTVSGLNASASGKDAGSYTSKVNGTAIVTDDKGKVVTGQFTVKGLNGTLTINKAQVTLKSKDLTKKYDGSPLVNGTNELETETGWKNGEGATYTFTGGQTIVGISDNSFFYTLNEGTKESNYIITKTEGTLNVVSKDAKEELVVEANSATATYDGQEHKAEGLKQTTFTIGDNTYTVSGLTASGAYGTNAGTYTNKVVGTAVVTDAKGNVVTDEFKVVGRNGSLEIGKATVNLKSADISRPYNGLILTNGDAALETESGWVTGEGATYTFTGTQLLVGSCDNEFNISLNSNTFAENYTINKTYGQLTVTGRKDVVTFTVESNGAEYTYDGQTHSVSGFKTLEFTDNGEKFIVDGLTASGASASDAGKYKNAITGTPIVKDAQGHDVTKQFEVATVEGVLKINPNGDLEIDTNGVTYNGPYDGTEHGGPVKAKLNGVEVSGLIVSYSTDGGKTWTTTPPTRKDVGTLNVDVKVEDPAGNYETVTTSYIINVFPRTVTLRSADISKVFDNEKLTNGDTPLAMESGWVAGEGATYTFTGEQKEVGSSSNTFTYKLTSQTKEANYSINVEAGCLSVTRKGAKYEITVVGKSETVTYDGKNHKVSGVVTTEFEIDGKKYKVEGLKTEEITAKNAGTYSTEVVGTAVVKDANSGKDVTELFNVKGQNGTLTIKKAVVTLKSADLSKKQDGVALVNGSTKLAIETGWAAGEGATYTFTGKQKKVGVSANKFGYKLKEGTIASNYEINKIEGTLNVTDGDPQDEKIDLVIKAKSAEAVYDGTVHEITGFTVTAEDGQTYNVTGIEAVGVSGKNAGTYTNKLTGAVKVLDGSGKDITDQFNIKAENGTLTIKKANVTLKSDNLSKEYDGLRLRNGNTALIQTGWVENEGLAKVSFTGSQKLVGSSDNAFGYSLQANTFADNYNITKIYGTLTVRHREKPFEVAVESVSATKSFNNKVQSIEGFNNLTFSDITQGVTFTVDGITAKAEGKNVGEYTNKISGTAKVLDDEGFDVTSEFKVNTTEGKLTITKAEGSIGLEIGENYKGEYDGKPHGVDVSVKVEDETTISYSIDGGKTWTNEPPTLTKVGAIEVMVKAENPNYATETGSYKIEVTPKNVTVTPKNIAIVFGNNDPTPLTTAVVDGLLGDDTIKYGFERDGGKTVGTYELRATGEETQGNYSVEYGKANFVIVRSSIDPNAPKEPDPNKPDDAVYDGLKVDKISDPIYDGTDHKIEPVIRDKNGNIVDPENFEITYPDSDYTNANEQRRIIIKGRKDKGYDGEITIYFNIKKRSVTLTSASASKTYDGTPLFKEEINVSGDGFIKGEGFIYKFSGTQTEVGSSDNTFEYTVNEQYTFTNPNNYNIKAVFGTLTVNAAAGPIVVPDGPNDGPGTVVRAITGQPLEQLADAETPLANFFEDCCILHLILLFLALVMFIIYIVDNKKRKNRIYELEEELAKNGVMYW